ncbi:PPE domain-containing protein [Amycolatopsis thermophila]|uniref:PPE domain-containing protein n=1 Tax=Amycolatopsis thermophila TaxID=206084 RepID=A0ABU0ESY7_9PSEU|nr:PPE domain-containing protein [Amycolatopsis thermophila]MDQ0378425.1 hypothetical protein [Amycolatopsis thermophila]
MATFDSSKYDIPTLVAKLRDQRFDGYQPEQLAQVVEKFRDGAGPDGITGAVEALKSISGALADTEEALRTQLKALGVEWQSRAAGQASSVVAQQAGYSGAATSKVEQAAQMMFQQAEAFTRTRNKLPAPEDLRKAGGYSFADTAFSLFGFETDHAADVRTAEEARAQAVDALNAYAHDSGSYLGSASTLETPERVEVLSAPGSGVVPAVGPVPSVPDTPTTVAQGTKDVRPAVAPAGPVTPPLGTPAGTTGGAGVTGAAAAAAPGGAAGWAPGGTTGSGGAAGAGGSGGPGSAAGWGGAVESGGGGPAGAGRSGPGGSAPGGSGGADRARAGSRPGWGVRGGGPGSPALAGDAALGGAGPAGASRFPAVAPGGAAGAPGSGPAGGAAPGSPGGGPGRPAAGGASAEGAPRGVPTGAEEALGKGRSAGSGPPATTTPTAVGPGFAAVRGASGLNGLAEAAPALGAAGAGGALAGEDERHSRIGRNNAGNRIHQIPLGDLPEEEEARLTRRGGHTPDSATTRAILEPAAPRDGEEDSVRRFGVDDNDLFADRRDVSPDTIGDR